jgi:NAD(P)-dependent dehydrogenase (short-subunit alcohol dehydrogenase family)
MMSSTNAAIVFGGIGKRNLHGPRPLEGRHALVTGAGRGIGAAIAEELARLGASVSLTGRHIDQLERQRGRMPGNHATYAMDVTDEASVRDVVERAAGLRGPVQILVNNAGAVASAPFLAGGIELWHRMLDVNVLGAVRCTRAVLTGMRELESGRIVNIASTAGLTGYAYVSAYTAAKHALVGLTRSLALELAKSGITVNAVCPGYTETDLLEESIDNIVRVTGRSEEEARAALVKANPLGRFIQPNEVAGSVAWLCLPSSAAITGQAIAVAGGEIM